MSSLKLIYIKMIIPPTWNILLEFTTDNKFLLTIASDSMARPTPDASPTNDGSTDMAAFWNYKEYLNCKENIR